jgi:hypothetical protein
LSGVRTGDESHRLNGVRTDGDDKSLNASELVLKNNRWSRIRVGVEEHTLSGIRTGDGRNRLIGFRTGVEYNCGAGSVDGSRRVRKLHSVVFNGSVWPTQNN